MELVFDKSFTKDLDKLTDKSVKTKIKDLIIETENANSISELANVKKLQGFKSYYRFRIGDYRVGVELEKENMLRFITVLHRKDIYKKFP